MKSSISTSRPGMTPTRCAASSGAVEGLLFVVGCQQAKDEGLSRHDTHGGEAIGDSLINVLVVTGFSFDDAAEADHGAHFFAGGE